MKFTTLMFITFVMVVLSSPSPIRARASTVGGFGEVAQSCVGTDLMPCLWSSPSPSPIRERASTVGGFGEVAQSCVVTDLMPCLPAMTTGGPPTGECCDKMNKQKPCLCGYIKNPALSTYVSSPNALKVLEACKVPIPKC